MTTIELSLIFIVYIMCGAAVFSAMTKDTYVNTLFINFRAITADFVEIVPLE
jgi:hypothetical protein